MSSPQDPWHFPRTSLAETHFALIDKGLANALVLFGRRRTGKTEFLLKDLTPVAENAKRTVVYVNFWSSPLAPTAVLIRALETALKGGPLFTRIGLAAEGLKPSVKVGAGAAGVQSEAALEFKSAIASSGDQLARIDDLFSKLASGKRKALILFDEVQELAAEPGNAALIAALRTSLDTRKANVAAVFTGSNRDGLNAMFARRAAPFFQFATAIDFPPLDDAFVDHLLAAFAKIVGPTLPRQAVLEAFHGAHSSPFFLRKLLEQLAFDPVRDVGVAAQALRARLASDLGYDRIWLSLTPLQRGLLAHFALGSSSPFSEGSRFSIGQAIDAPPPSPAQLQTALRKLLRLKLVLRLDGRSEYVLDDPELGAWIVASLAGP
jgi:hypothetical protein